MTEIERLHAEVANLWMERDHIDQEHQEMEMQLEKVQGHVTLIYIALDSFSIAQS
jgi:hypothetical protein